MVKVESRVTRDVESKRSILATLAVFVLLFSSFTFSSCKTCGKAESDDNPKTDGSNLVDGGSNSGAKTKPPVSPTLIHQMAIDRFKAVFITTMKTLKDAMTLAQKLSRDTDDLEDMVYAPKCDPKPAPLRVEDEWLAQIHEMYSWQIDWAEAVSKECNDGSPQASDDSKNEAKNCRAEAEAAYKGAANWFKRLDEEGANFLKYKNVESDEDDGEDIRNARRIRLLENWKKLNGLMPLADDAWNKLVEAVKACRAAR
jgi:hypothetical protein